MLDMTREALRSTRRTPAGICPPNSPWPLAATRSVATPRAAKPSARLIATRSAPPKTRDGTKKATGARIMQSPGREWDEACYGDAHEECHACASREHRASAWEPTMPPEDQ